MNRHVPLLAAICLALLLSAGAGAVDTYGRWSYEARIVADESQDGDRFGSQVALSGSTLAVGAHYALDADRGAVYLFERGLDGPARWGEALALHGDEDDWRFGAALALEGDRLAVGSWSERVRIFERPPDDLLGWEEVAELTVEGDPDGLGEALAMLGDTIVAGAPLEGNRLGAVYVFERVGSAEWELTARLAAPDGASGDEFGYSLAFDGTTLVVGAPEADPRGRNAGAAYVFTSDGAGGWSEGVKLVASDGTQDDSFGRAVGVDGDQVLVGAPFRTGGQLDSDSVYVFTRQEDAGEAGPGEWVETSRLIARGDAMGVQDGRAAIEGAYSVSIFERDGDEWSETARLWDEDRYGGGNFGQAVALDGDSLAVGANAEEFGRGNYSGIAYVFHAFELTLAVGGTCPGWLDIEVSGVTPDAPVALAAAAHTGRAEASGECEGTVAYLRDPVRLATGRADGSGRLAAVEPIGVGSCEMLFQAIDLESCETSNLSALRTSSHVEVTKLDDGRSSFGRAVALDGARILVGASQGATVWARDPSDPLHWELEADLAPIGPVSGFGSDVALAGGAAAVADVWEDTVFVFESDAGGEGAWGQVARLEAYGGDGGYPDSFANSVAMSGPVLAVGAALQSGAESYDGAVYLYLRLPDPPGLWAPIARLWAEEGHNNARFGHDVALDGGTLVVGAPNYSGLETSSGAAFVFEADGHGEWQQVATLTVPEPQGYERFGEAVAIDGDTVVVGAPDDEVAERSAGAAYVFRRDAGGPGAWGLVTRLEPHRVFVGDELGTAVGISGDTVAVRAWPDEPIGRTGTVYIFERNHGGLDAWGEVDRLTPSDGYAFQDFGVALALSGQRLVVGADGYGGAYVYQQKPPWVGRRER